jgi:hypothetical protein
LTLPYLVVNYRLSMVAFGTVMTIETEKFHVHPVQRSANHSDQIEDLSPPFVRKVQAFLDGKPSARPYFEGA